MSDILEKIIDTEIIRPRRCGYTTAIIEAAKKVNGTVVCANEKQAKELRFKYKVKAVSVSASTWKGSVGPYLWDSFAFASAHNQIANVLEIKNQKVKELEQQLKQRDELIEEACKHLSESQAMDYELFGEGDYDIQKFLKKEEIQEIINEENY